MDGREGMALQGSSPYYFNRAISCASEQGHGGHFTSPSPPPGYRPINPNISDANHVVKPAFNVEGGPMSQPNNGPPQGFSITVASAGGSLSEPLKKKRGRPRKYRPDGANGVVGPGSVSDLGSGSGSMALALSPSSPNSGTPGDRKKRGRPPGSGRKQRLASVGEWMSNSAGVAFMPHVIHVQPGEDIAGKILSFAQQRPRALCIMSGSGGVSAVTLRQPASSTGTVTFEGRFEILCLSGSYLVAETDGSRNRIGGVNVSLSSPDGHVIGGAVGGRLVASRLVQVVVCSFVYGSIKGRSTELNETDEKCTELSGMKASPTQNVTGSWPGPKEVDSNKPMTGIDLASG
ncbi:AT-hook motif nuclear-localized protein 5-like [Silene latifolia]|uniref:AT-hook motif nuclear-localized protein 5-like n=1 Tax=Silene latifolia TaxID=37657 RepID=UPI003D781717